MAKSSTAQFADKRSWSKRDLEKLFNSHIMTLKKRGCPEQIVEALQNQKDAVLKKASGMTISEGHIPFLPVIPRSYRSPYDLMAMVRHGNETGRNFLNQTLISDKVDTPSDPYFIYDIETGQATLGLSPENAKNVFKKAKRSGLTVAETIALAIHTDTLSHHNLWASGSRYESSDGVPGVWLYDGWPWLGYDHAGSSNTRWGSPSCGSR